MVTKARQKGQAAASGETETEEKTEAPAKVKRSYFCEGTGQPIDHKARFGGMGFDAQLKSRLVNAALKNEKGTRYDNATGEAIHGDAATLLADLGWSAFLVKAQESRATKATAKATRAAAVAEAKANKETKPESSEDEDEDDDDN